MEPIRIGTSWEGPSPEPSWLAELAAIAPPTDYGHSWLRLVWEPGELWAPVNRWMIWEMLPPWRAPLPEIAEELRGPNPRNFGYYDRVLGRFVSARNFLISERQWLLHRETGCYGRPLWVVQGRHGGHKRYWRDVEGNLSALHGGPEEPPPPGGLAYNEPDRRTWDALRALDRMHKYGDIIARAAENPGLFERDERELINSFGRELMDWLDAQMEASMEFTRAQWSELADRVCDDDAPYLDADEEEERFLEELQLTY